MPTGRQRDLLETGTRACESRGYTVTRRGRVRGPAAVATPDGAASPMTGGPAGPTAIEPIAEADATPATLVERLQRAVEDDRHALFVGSEAVAEAVVGVLDTPPFLADETPDGERTFYNGSERVRLAGGGYALARPGGDALWSEERDGRGRNGGRDTTDEAEASTNRSERLVLRAGYGPIAAVDGVGSLTVAPTERFPFHYRRGPDGRLRVRDHRSEIVGSYPTEGAMCADGFEPVVAPLVPESIFSEPESVAQRWGVLSVGADEQELHVPITEGVE